MIRVIVGTLDLLFGMLFVLGAGLSMYAIPSALQNYNREPTDLFLLAFFFLLSVFLALVALLAGIALVRNRGFQFLSPGKLAALMVTASIVFLCLSVIRFTIVIISLTHQFFSLVSFAGLCFFLVSAGTFMWSAYLIRR